MKSNPEHIKGLCDELRELGIIVKPTTMELILRMQEQDYRYITDGINPEVEFENFLSRISGK